MFTSVSTQAAENNKNNARQINTTTNNDHDYNDDNKVLERQC